MSVISEEAVETVAESTEEPVAEETPVTVEEPEETLAEEATDEVSAEETPEHDETADTVSVVFTPDDPDVHTKVAEVLDKYEIPQEVQAVIDHFKSQAETSSNDFSAYADYGDAEAVKALLDRQALLDSVTDAENGYRPNTDKFAETLDPEKASWLFFDLGSRPSQKYQGLSQFEEGIADSLAVEGDTVGTVLTRYKQAIEAFKGGNITGSTPDFIPNNLQEAYWSLSKEERDELDSFSPDTDRIEYDDSGRAINIDEPIRQRKLDTLAKIQKGIDGDKFLKQQEDQTKAQRQEAFHQDVATTQEKFYSSLRATFAEDLVKTVQFSTDPKMQTILANQNVALLTQAFSPDSEGDWARQVLADSGVKFDNAKAQQLVKDIEIASVTLAHARQIQDSSGRPINQVELNKAKASFEKAGKAWQIFAKDILMQEARLTSTGKQKDVEKAAEEKIEKKKLEIKARPSTKGSPAPAAKPQNKNPHRYGSEEWDRWYIDQMQEEARNGNRAYSQVS